MGSRSRKGVWKACHPCCLAQGLFIWYIWLPQNHKQHQFYKTTQDLTTPTSSCGKAERGKKHWLHRTHSVTIQDPPSTSKQIKVPRNSFPPLSSLLFLIILWALTKNYSSSKTEATEYLTRRYVCLFLTPINIHLLKRSNTLFSLWKCKHSLIKHKLLFNVCEGQEMEVLCVTVYILVPSHRYWLLKVTQVGLGIQSDCLFSVSRQSEIYLSGPLSSF